MNETLPPPATAATIMEPAALPLPPIDTEGASTYHVTAAQVPLEFGGTLRSSKGSKGSKNNSNQQSPQKKSAGSNSNTDHQSGSYCTCFGGCGYGQRSRIAMPFWPAVLANLGICALLAGYIFIGSFIFLTIEKAEERVAQLPQVTQQQQQMQPQSFGSPLPRQADNSSVGNRTARSALGTSGDVATRRLAKSDATPEVSAHINGADGSGATVGGTGDVVVKRHLSIVAGSRSSTPDESVDEDYIGDDGSVYDGAATSTLTVEDVERHRTVENIWDITVSLNILYKENWTRLAALEIAKFQDQLVKRLVMDLTLSTANGATQSTAATAAHGKQRQSPTGYGNFERQRFWQAENQRQQHWWSSNQRLNNRAHRARLKSERFEWNFATAFLYSMTVITTVGYGTITARTTLGRMVTMGYATLGIPLTLIYLSSIGSVLAKVLRYCCSLSSAAQRRGRCCYCCCSKTAPRTPPTHRQDSIGGGSIFNRHPQVADRKAELRLKHFQQPQQQQPLPYCYVRPPAASAQEMEMQQQQQQQHGGTAFDNLSAATSATEATRQQAAAAVLSWSLAAPAGFCVLFLIAYVAFGAVVVALLEDWPLIDGVYFCFMSLSTIGFCDLLPGLNADGGRRSSTAAAAAAAATTSNVAVWFCAVYILSGLTLTSMCVNLLHDEIASRMRVVVKFEKVHELQLQEQRESGYYSARS